MESGSPEQAIAGYRHGGLRCSRRRNEDEGKAVRIHVLSGLAVALCAVGVVSSGVAPAIAAESPVKATTTIVITNDIPTTVTRPSTSPDSPVGTEYFHEAVVRNAKGAVIGSFHATVLTVDVTPGDVVETRLRTVVFNLKDGQIVATGVADYPTRETYLVKKGSARIAIVGGTGKYLGALGQMVTERRDDGSYRHVLTLVK